MIAPIQLDPHSLLLLIRVEANGAFFKRRQTLLEDIFGVLFEELCTTVARGQVVGHAEDGRKRWAAGVVGVRTPGGGAVCLNRDVR